MERRQLAVGLVLLAVATALVVAAAWPTVVALAGPAESGYGYSVTVATNASLSDVTLVLPLPADAEGTGPVVAAFRAGDATVPDGWSADVVTRDGRPMLELRADAVPAERQADGRRYSTFQVSARAAADHTIDTGDPYGTEPTIAPTDGRREVPCPNLAGPAGGQTCYAFDAAVYAAYDAPAEADVDVQLVAAGANEFRLGGRAQYYERLLVLLEGARDGWVAVDGFASTDAGP